MSYKDMICVQGPIIHQIVICRVNFDIISFIPSFGDLILLT